MDSDLYRDWLPENLYYLVHLVAWMGPVVILQWLIGARILRRNLRAIAWPVLIAGTYLVATDVIAVHLGIWHFDSDMILAGLFTNQPPGLLAFLTKPFGVPIEEWLFFYLTALLCAQSFILFLPGKYRAPPIDQSA